MQNFNTKVFLYIIPILLFCMIRENYWIDKIIIYICVSGAGPPPPLPPKSAEPPPLPLESKLEWPILDFAALLKCSKPDGTNESLLLNSMFQTIMYTPRQKLMLMVVSLLGF